MIYDTPRAWRDAPQKRLLWFGMSGLGKTRAAAMLRETGDWFHYSIDYRIGTAYLGEHISDNLKREAMRVPFLADLLRSDSIYLGSNITFDNLAPLSTWLGKPGRGDAGGLPFDEYMGRQALHRRAEVNTLLDTPHFIRRAHDLYGYRHFVADTGGSICEVVDPENPDDEVLQTLSAATLMVWIEGDEAHEAELVRRFEAAPKPMYYRPETLTALWTEYLDTHGVAGDAVDPDAFVRFAYTRAISRRTPIYAAMARNWGLRVHLTDMAGLRDATDVTDLVAEALGRRAAAA
ncbi:MAG: ATPase [Pseudomonadota bacterium]